MKEKIESKVTFLDVGEGKRIPLRSRLEARWAVFFSQCGLRWQYEPQTFRLPSGLPYTPDFLVENVGWFEIKPTQQKLYEERVKIVEFCKSAGSLLAKEAEKHYFVSTGSYPAVDNVMLGYAPTNAVALVSRFHAASFFQELPFATYKRVIELAETKAKAFRQDPIDGRELSFILLHEELGIPFRKLAKDYTGKEEFSATVEEFGQGLAKKRAERRSSSSVISDF